MVFFPFNNWNKCRGREQVLEVQCLSIFSLRKNVMFDLYEFLNYNIYVTEYLNRNGWEI